MDEVEAALRTHPQRRGRLRPGVDQLVCPILRALGGKGGYRVPTERVILVLFFFFFCFLWSSTLSLFLLLLPCHGPGFQAINVSLCTLWC